MTRIIYCDTCIYLNLYKNERGKWLNVAERARELFNRVKNGRLKLIVSDHLEGQLKYKDYYDKYSNFIDDVDGKNLIEVKIEKKDRRKANKMNNKHSILEFEDALHAELALKGNAEILVTRNFEHFSPYRPKFKKIRAPESI